MWIKKYVIISLLVLTACSTTEQSSDFDSTLYSGKPVESLTNDEPPKTEEEAISRGDIALSNKNVGNEITMRATNFSGDTIELN